MVIWCYFWLTVSDCAQHLECTARTAITDTMSFAHLSVTLQYSPQFEVKYKRRNFATPKNYLDFLSNYMKFLENNRNSLDQMSGVNRFLGFSLSASCNHTGGFLLTLRVLFFSILENWEDIYNILQHLDFKLFFKFWWIFFLNLCESNNLKHMQAAWVVAWTSWSKLQCRSPRCQRSWKKRKPLWMKTPSRCYQFFFSVFFFNIFFFDLWSWTDFWILEGAGVDRRHQWEDRSGHKEKRGGLEAQEWTLQDDNALGMYWNCLFLRSYSNTCRKGIL